MSDTIITPDLIEDIAKNKFLLDFGKSRREMLVEGELFDITEFGKTVGMKHPAAITQMLFKELYPWAEDGVKGVAFDQRIADMVKGWGRAASGSDKTYVKFTMEFETYVKNVKSYEDIETFSDGKARLKTLKIFSALHPGDMGEPVLTFGIDKF